MLYDLLAKFAPISQPVRIKPKPIVACSHTFSRAWRRLHVISWTSDWLMALFVSLLNYFGLGFNDAQMKIALKPPLHVETFS